MDKTPAQIVREQLAAGPARNWAWEEDGDFVGTIIGAFKADTKFRKDCPVLVCQTESGEVVNVWLSNGVLEKKVLETNPMVGDTYGIQRGELVQGKVNEYRNWNVVSYKMAGGPLFLPSATQPTPALPAGTGANEFQYQAPVEDEGAQADSGEDYSGWRQ